MSETFVTNNLSTPEETASKAIKTTISTLEKSGTATGATVYIGSVDKEFEYKIEITKIQAKNLN